MADHLVLRGAPGTMDEAVFRFPRGSAGLLEIVVEDLRHAWALKHKASTPPVEVLPDEDEDPATEMEAEVVEIEADPNPLPPGDTHNEDPAPR